MKNKILPILCIFILISLTFISNVFAYETTFNDISFYIPDELLTIAEGLPEYSKVGTEYDMIITHNINSQKDYAIIFFTKGGSLYDILTYDGSTMRELAFKDCTAVKGYFYENITYKFKYEYKSFYTIQYLIVDGVNHIYSQKDIYTDQNCTNLFFQLPVQEITLAQELEKIQVTQVWKNLMQNVLVSLIVFLVGFLAFSKAWTWLKTQLHQA